MDEQPKSSDNECEIIAEKTEDEVPSENGEIKDLLVDMSNFVVKQVIRNNTSQKLLCVEGTFKDRDGAALIIMEKKVFPAEEELLESGFFNNKTKSNELYRNDIYSGYDLFPQVEFNGLKATLIYPATQKHIDRHKPTEFFMVEETPEIYEKITLPNILESKEQYSLKWVENILDGTSEAERVIYNDTDEENGFVLVKDLKWDDDLSTLYLIAIARKAIKSIRDLNETHLPLLRNIKEAGTKAIFEKYGIPKTQLRVYFHYQPSYYHLHVHFSGFGFENAGTFAERAHLLSNVISNIELMPDYYQKAVLTFRIPTKASYEPYENFEKEKNTSENDL